MNTIGNFKRDGERFNGIINTLAFSGQVSFEPVAKRNEASPDFQITGGRARVEIGAAWKERSERGTSYLGVKLDAPGFPAPIYCRLVQFEGEDEHRLIWSRN
jgi:uncharacterized protein (DUF736 family)